MFFDTIKSIYEQASLICKNMVADRESVAYAGFDARVQDSLVKFRCARVTPKKLGQFVTFWKRDAYGISVPYDVCDQVDFFVIAVFKDEQRGKFIFPKKVLCEKNIISSPNKEGRRAIRLYPPWESNLNRQAQKTQKWQLDYFVYTSQILTETQVQRMRALYAAF